MGSRWSSGPTEPSPTRGEDNDFYLQTTGNFRVWKKRSGLWVRVVNIKGPPGPPGADGLDGADGATGFPDTAPDAPSAFDDECLGASMDAKWTADVVASASGASQVFQAWNGKGMLCVSPGAGSNNETRYHQALTGFAAGTALTIVGKFFCSVVNASIGFAGFSVGTSPTFEGGSFVDALLNGGGHILKAVKYDGASASENLSEGIYTWYLAFHRNASNSARLLMSHDCKSWNVFDGPGTRNWNADYLHLLFRGGGGSQPTALGMEWIRVNDPRIIFPPF